MRIGNPRALRNLMGHVMSVEPVVMPDTLKPTDSIEVVVPTLVKAFPVPTALAYMTVAMSIIGQTSLEKLLGGVEFFCKVVSAVFLQTEKDIPAVRAFHELMRIAKVGRPGTPAFEKLHFDAAMEGVSAVKCWEEYVSEVVNDGRVRICDLSLRGEETHDATHLLLYEVGLLAYGREVLAIVEEVRNAQA